MIKPKKIVVVGGNAAGPAAAAKAKRINPEAEVVMFEAGSYISTGTCEIPYVISGDIKSFDDLIYFNPEEFNEKKGVKVFTNHLVEEINRKEKFISVKNLKENIFIKEAYDKLILATGSKPKVHPSFPRKSENVFNLTTLQDLKEVLNFISYVNVKNAAVFGSGYIGLEAVDALQQKGLEVTIIEKENLPLPYTEPELQQLILELLEKNNIRFFGGVSEPKVVPTSRDENKVESIIIEGRVLHFDLILIAIGFEPNVSLARQAKLEIGRKGGIKVDNRLRTSDPHIYAAGDNIEIINAITNKPDYIPLATIAHEFGHVAGENAAGGNIRVEPVIKNIAVKILEKFHISVGISTHEAKEYSFQFETVSASASNLVIVMPQSENVFGKIIYEKESRRILGAVFFGGKEISGYGDLISALIKTKQPANVLSRINYNYTPPLSPYINLLSILGRKIK